MASEEGWRGGGALCNFAAVTNDPSSTPSYFDLALDLYAYVSEPSGVAPLLGAPGADVSLADFEHYLRSLATSWPAFVAAREARQAHPARGESSSGRAAFSGQLGSLDTNGDSLLQAMQEVPVAFFARDFDFAYPETFAAICGEGALPASQSLVLQERLSSYTDAVECHLQDEICRRSDSFFEALGVLTELLNGIAITRTRVDSLRISVRLLDETVMGAALRLARLQVRRRNARALVALLCAVEAVETSLGDLQLLLEAQDFAAALDVMEDARRALAQPELARLHISRPATARLEAAAQQAQRLLCSEFVRVARPPRLRADALPPAVAAPLQRVAAAAASAEASVRRSDAGLAPEPAASPEEAAAAAADGEGEEDEADGEGLGEEVEEELLADAAAPLLSGLLRMGALAPALRLHREALQLEVRAAVKEVLGLALRSVAAAQQPAAAPERSLGDRLRSLPVACYVALLEAVAAAVLAVVQRAVAVHELARALLQPPPEGGAPGAAEEALRESAEAVAAAGEAAAQRWAKLLLVRGPVHARLRVPQMALVAATTSSFADALDARCGGRRSAVLRATLSTQAKALLCALHEQASSQLSASLDAEQWSRCDVPPAFQAMADGLVCAGLGLDPPAWGGAGGGDALEFLQLGGVPFACVASSLLLLRTLAQYVEFAAALPSLATEALHRALEALKMFNSRSCALVLGAEALQSSAGLRSITAKHLGLASLQLRLALALLPHVRSALGRALPPSRQALLLTALDRCDADLQLHRAELHSKCLLLAGERLRMHLGQLGPLSLRWAAEPAEGPDPSPSELAVAIAEELASLGRVLSPLLPPAEAAQLFARVVAAFDRSLCEGLARCAEEGGGARRHIQADARCLVQSLGDLPSDGGERHGAPGLLALCEAMRLPASGGGDGDGGADEASQ